MPKDRPRKMGLALMVVCPACAGGLFLAIGLAFGVTALALKGFALGALLTAVGGLWARNIWRRRNEDESCHLATPPEAKSP